MTNLKGAMTALITPFKEGNLDSECYAALIKRQINNGIDVVVPVGTTGESATLSHNEHKACIEIAVDVCRGTTTQVLAGAGSNATSEAVDLAKFAQTAGADGILAVTPYYNKPSQEGLYQHYKAIAEAIDIGVMLYNVPGRTAVDMEAQTAIRLYDDIDNIFAIKEATGSVDRTISITSKRPDFGVISGDDAINFAIMTNGGTGTISVTANLLPDMVSQLIHATQSGDIHTAAKLNAELYDINNVLFCESNPIPIKAAMHIAGLMPNLEYRLPLVGLESANYKRVEDVMNKYEIKGL
jgi:4-hydroxy-tetrahydrodipicolinate synthase